LVSLTLNTGVPYRYQDKNKGALSACFYKKKTFYSLFFIMLNFTRFNLKCFFLKYYHLNKIALLITLFVALGCKSSKNTSHTLSQIENEPKILFLNYSIVQADNGERSIKFINKKIVDGKMKPQTFHGIENGKTGDLIFTEFNAANQTLNQILITDPLIRHVEYLDDSKQFQTKTITSDEMQFSIRLQLKNNTKYITISNFASSKPLIKTQIN